MVVGGDNRWGQLVVSESRVNSWRSGDFSVELGLESPNSNCVGQIMLRHLDQMNARRLEFKPNTRGSICHQIRVHLERNQTGP